MRGARAVVDNRRIFRNTIFLYLRMALVMGVSIFTSGVVMRVLGVVDYGLNAVLGGVVAMFSFLNSALSASVSRNFTFELGRGDVQAQGEVFNVSFVVFAVLGLLIVLLSETVGLWFFRTKMVIPADRIETAFWVLQLSIFLCPLSLLAIPYNAVLIAHENMGVFAAFSILDVFAKLGIVGLLYLSPYDKLLSLAVLGAAWGLVSIALTPVYCTLKYPETRLRLCRSSVRYGQIVSYAGSDLIGNLSQLAQGQGLNLLLNTFFGPAVNAARGIAYSVQGNVFKFCDNFMTAVRPQITKSYAVGDEKGMWELVGWSTCLAYQLLWVFALPVCIEADYLLTLWLGSYPPHTLTFLYLVFAICLVDVLQRPIVYVMHATGHILLYNFVTGSIICLSFPLAWLFLRQGFAPESVFVASMAVFIVGFVVEMFILKRYVDYSILSFVREVVLRSVAVTLITTGVVVPCCRLVGGERFWHLVTTICLSVFAVAICTWFVGFDRPSRTKMRDFAMKRIQRITGGRL